MKRRGLLTVIALAGLGALVGCSAGNALLQAQQSFEQARAAGAETRAPYEFYAAQEYLGLAEHENMEMDFKATREFAEQSARFSAEAVEKAGGGAR